MSALCVQAPPRERMLAGARRARALAYALADGVLEGVQVHAELRVQRRNLRRLAAAESELEDDSDADADEFWCAQRTPASSACRP